MSSTIPVLIMGAAGRDFHDYLTWFRDRPEYDVRAFTAEQIPFIADRRLPPEFCPADKPDGIPIRPDAELEQLIRSEGIELVFLSLSDLPYTEVMRRSARVLAAGAGFAFLGPRQIQLVAREPVLAITGTRTGVGKSPLTQYFVRRLIADGHRPAVVRHPMPYGDLAAQRLQRFESMADLDAAECTLEEREEYAPYVEMGAVIYAGVDYRMALDAAEREGELVIWDGGNNDLPFFSPDVHIVVTDALRPGDEIAYHPGEVNLRTADAVVINKVDGATPAALDTIRANIAAANPDAAVTEANLEISVDFPDLVRGKRALVVEDGPTLTHGGMATGAGWLAAERFGAAEVIDPRSLATGTLASAFAAWPHIGRVLPALGYSDAQRAELLAVIEAAGADVIVDASPARLDSVFAALPAPVCRVSYTFVERGSLGLYDWACQRLGVR